jgi:anti-anti-sigma regulatory factor
METIYLVSTHVSEPLDDHIMDLRRLAQLDSRTLGGLIRSSRIVRESGGSVGLLVDQRGARRIFSITGLDGIPA